MGLHAKLSPSGAKRWSNCPESLTLSEGMPEQSSPYAEEGTRAHVFASAALQGLEVSLEGYKYPGEVEDMRKHARAWVKGVEEWSFTPSTILVEESVCAETSAGRVWGTADAIAISKDGKDMLVADYKYGAGVRVLASENGIPNEQIAIYAYCALRSIGPAERVKTVTLAVFQPRISAQWSYTSLSVEELDSFVNSICDRYVSNKGKFRAGSWCQWCRAKPICQAAKEHAEVVVQNAKEIVADNYQDLDAVAAFLKHDASFLRSLAKSIEDYAKGAIRSGHVVPGYKLVMGKSRRKWASDVDMTVLRDLGFTGEPELPTPAVVEKQVGKGVLDDFTRQYDTFERLVTDSTSGKPVASKQEVIDLLQPLDIS